MTGEAKACPSTPRAAKLAKRTLTHLYNERPSWLAHAHAAVAAAYGWPADLTDQEILAGLLERNRTSGAP